MSKRMNDKHWEQDGDQYRLWGTLHDWEEKESCLAILARMDGYGCWIWTVMNFQDNMAEPSELDCYNIEGFEEYDTLEEAQEAVEECIRDRIADLIGDLEDIQELFES